MLAADSMRTARVEVEVEVEVKRRSRQYVRALNSLPTILSPIAKPPATKNTHATSIDIGIMLLLKKRMPKPKRIANEVSTRYLKYFFTTNSVFFPGFSK